MTFSVRIYVSSHPFHSSYFVVFPSVLKYYCFNAALCVCVCVCVWCVCVCVCVCYTGKEPADLQTIPPEEVAFQIRPFFEKLKLDPALSEQFENQDIDGQLLSELTDDNIIELFPKISIGHRLKVAKAVKLTLEELKKNLEAASRQIKLDSRSKLETYREFDARPKPHDVYEKGFFLPDEQSRPNSLLQPIHRYYMNENVQDFATQTIRFAAACMNDRANGTIHFGVTTHFESSSDCQGGKIVGVPVNKQQFELAVTDEIYRAFYDDQREIALMCIRDPVYIPVINKDGVAEELYVVEVDVVPKSSVVNTEVFFLKPSTGRRSLLLRYIDGAATEVNAEEQKSFMELRRKLQTDYRREEEEKLQSRSSRRPNLHRKLHGLLTGENDYADCDIFPLLFLSPCPDEMTNDYLIENFRCIKSLDPLAVFDFNSLEQDSYGQCRGFFPVMESHFEQVYKVLTTDNFDLNSEENRSSENAGAVARLFEDVSESSLKTWIFCNGYEPMQKKELQAAAWRSQRGQGFKEAVRFYEKEIPPDNARILIFVFSDNYDVFWGALEEIFTKFPDQWILVVESERVAQDLSKELLRRSYVEKEVLNERCVIGMPWSHVNQSIMKICGYSTVSGCTLPTASGTSVFLKEKKKNEWSDLDILSMTQCIDEDLNQDELDKKSRQTEEEFFRGQEVKWWNFYFKTHVLEREQTKELRSLVSDLLDGKISDDERVGVVNLLHQPGAGATTIARHVLWDMKTKARCCVIKRITDKTCDQIARFRSFEEQDFAPPPVVLIDNDITDLEKICSLRSQLNERARREARLSKAGAQKIFCVLIICKRIRASLKGQGRYQDKLKVTVDHELQPPELLWFKMKAEEIDRKYKDLQGRHPALLISFNLLKENFNRVYIQRTVAEFIAEIRDFKEKRLLKYIALLNNFDFAFQSIPLSAFNLIMYPRKDKKVLPLLGQKVISRGDTYWEASLSKSLNVLLNRRSKRCLGKGVDSVRIIHANLSQEILDNLCEREGSKLSDVILEFLHSDIFRKSNRSFVQDQLMKIAKSMLKTRVANDRGREDFAPIILAIGKTEGYEQAAEVLKAGFDIFEDPMIGQQAARIFLRLQKWDEAERYAEYALNMDPGNSFLCDTYGQVFKWKLNGMWNACIETIHNIDDRQAREMVDTAFRAIDIFQEEQKLSDTDLNSDYNNYGFTSELRVIATLLDMCLFLRPFSRNRDLLRRFLLNEEFVPEGLVEIIGNENISKLKKLYQIYEKPLRRLEEEGIQLKEDPAYQDSPSYKGHKENVKAASKIKVQLLSYFGEDSDMVPKHFSEEEACEYRRRRVKKLGGMSLYSTHEMRGDQGAEETFKNMYSMLMKNISSEFCNADDLRGILNLTLVRISLNRKCSSSFFMPEILKWTFKLLKMSAVYPRPYLEAFLYFVMFHWPTDWRKEQNLPLCSCSQLKEVIMKWKQAFIDNHPAQSKERKRPDRRKATTLFFLGQGTGFDEIAFYSEIRHLERNGEGIWNFPEVHRRLKLLKGILCYEGKKVSLTICSAREENVTLEVSTSYPIADDLMWQKTVYFFLGFCWSGLRAYGVRRDEFDLHPEPGQPVVRDSGVCGPLRNISLEQKMSEDEMFWRELAHLRKKMDELDKKIRVCPQKVLSLSVSVSYIYIYMMPCKLK